MSDTKFWIVYSSDLNKHAPQACSTESQAESLANKLARENLGTHLYVLESKSYHVGTVEVDYHTLRNY